MVSLQVREIVDQFNFGDSQTTNVNKALAYVDTKARNRELDIEAARSEVESIYLRAKLQWDQCNRVRGTFEANNAEWLASKFPTQLLSNGASTSNTNSCSLAADYEQSSELAERMKIRFMEHSEESANERTSPTRIARRKAYRLKEYNIMKQISLLLQSPRDLLISTDHSDMLSDEEVLAFYIDLGLTEAQYKSMSSLVPSRFPSFNAIRRAEALCVPFLEKIVTTECAVKMEMQCLVEYTVRRILEMQKKVLRDFLTENQLNVLKLRCVFTYGIDATSDHGTDVLISVLVPIQLHLDDASHHIFWLNVTPQNYRFCRPISLQLAKPSKALVLQTKHSVDEQISNLKPMHIVLEYDKAIDVEFEFVLSMIEGKVLSYMLDDSSTTCCLICCATPSEMMDASILASGFIGQEEPLVYSISPIHCWVTFFELLLQLSYRMDFKEWQVPEEQRTTFNERMKTVQQRLYEAFGVRVAEADAGSSSSTSTMGYISRRVFDDPALASTTLNIDEDLIERFRNILIAINSRHPLHPAKVQQYGSDTYRKYLQLYSWSRVPAAVHKVLAHAGELIVRSPVRLGYVGKKSGEIEHNYFPSDRKLCARTTSKQDSLKDAFVEKLICSDPKISSISLSNRIKRKKRAAYPDVVASFFIFDESYCETDDDDDSNSGDDDEDDLDSLDEFWTELDWLNEDIAHVKG